MGLWSKLPTGFLKMSFKTWSRLDFDIRSLIIKLARDQNFKCVHCDESHGLIVEHDHYPDHGRGDRYTVYNIRGLVCHRCNWHLGKYEQEKRGDYSEWSDFHQYISDGDYDSYIFAYECRVSPLLEAMIEKRLGSRNYWRRRSLLTKFDDWREWGGRRRTYPWYWGFNEIKEKKYWHIKTPEQAIRNLAALIRYVLKELEKNPAYEPPEEFLKLMVRVKPLLDSIRPIVEERLKSIGVEQDRAL